MTIVDWKRERAQSVARPARRPLLASLLRRSR
jgi:hypothetical protein